MHHIQIDGLAFREGQRVVVVMRGKKVDEGRIRRIGFADGGPAENPQVILVSEALGGREAVFGYYWEEKCWRLLFQNSVGSSAELSESESYLLEAIGS